MPNASFDTLLTTTLNKHLPDLVDNIFTDRPLLHWIERKGMKKIQGGAKVIIPLVYATNSTFKSYAGYDTLDTTPQEEITAAEYDWKQLAGTVAVSGIEEAKNRGPEAVIDLVQAKVEVLRQTASEALNDQLHGAGTTNANKVFHGLQGIVEASNPGWGNLGNIDRDANAWWKAYEENTAAALTLAQVNTGHNTISKGGTDSPDFHITTQTLFEKFWALLQPQQRFIDAKTADAGFTHLAHNGAVIMFDADVPSGVWYFLNSKYLHLVTHTDVWFKLSPFQTPVDADASYAKLRLYGNFVASNCARLGKLTAKTG